MKLYTGCNFDLNLFITWPNFYIFPWDQFYSIKLNMPKLGMISLGKVKRLQNMDYGF